MNYFQVVFILLNLKLEWPPLFDNFFSGNRLLSNCSEKVFGLSCYSEDSNSKEAY
eukprot:CAMPEP_0204908450 /NCGR_PEP_ID=MMETSP1397-20131031/7401_1 /ASSEMBLY_ACC=CAM_ASM_000891 /TAXON_ID=49980 /ORGANISM="Climacostomum Climacostomum virens, Strain Stock W-24" /LENGTH=54 /DNA_ID=CAMNT_0052077977 /DNA_START=29 /DNA_END=190 /DNA_ORIENTATION=-